MPSSTSTNCWPGRVSDRMCLAPLPATSPSSCRPWVAHSCKGASGHSANGTVWPACIVVVDQGGPGPVTTEWVAALQDKGLVVEHVRMNQAGIAAATNRGFETGPHSLRGCHA